MNVGQLIQRLSTYPADMPVVLEARDDPLGDYEVATVDRTCMEHERTYDDCGVRVYHHAGDVSGHGRFDPPADVVLLGFEERPRPVIDAESPHPPDQ